MGIEKKKTKSNIAHKAGISKRNVEGIHLFK